MPRKTTYHRITSDEKLKLINKGNLRLRDDFLTYLRSLRRSDGTIKGYESDLNIVFTYMLDTMDNKDFKDLTKRDIVSIQNWLSSNGSSSARIRRIKASISSLSNYIENILADDEPEFKGYRATVRKIGNPPLQPVREKSVWTHEELKDLLDRIVANGDYEKACFAALAAYSGRRKSELCRFRVDDFAKDRLLFDGALYKSAPILTKGHKMLECYTLARHFTPYLALWMDERERLGITSEWLFPNNTDQSRQVSLSTVNSWAKSIDRISPKPFYYHGLRHFFVTHLSQEGVPDNVVVQIVGWTSSEMFNVYNDSSKDDQIGTYFKNGGIDATHKKNLSDI